MINFKTQTPNELVGKLMILQYLYMHHTPEECEEMVKGTRVVEELFDEEGKPALFFNWEAMLFEIPNQELDHLTSRLYEKAELEKHKEKVVQGIINAQNEDEVAKQKARGLLLSSQEILTGKLAEIGLVDADSNPVGKTRKELELINPETVGPPMTIHMNNFPAKPVLPKTKK